MGKKQKGDWEEEEATPKKKVVATRILFIRDMPKALMLAYKALCALRGISMKEGLCRLLREDVKRSEEAKE